MTPFAVATYYQQLLDSTSDINLTFIQNRQLRIPAGTTVNINVRFLSGVDAGTIANPATGSDIWVTLKRTTARTDTQLLAEFHTASAPSGDDYFSGQMNTSGDELMTALDASIEAATKGTELTVIMLITYKKAGQNAISTLPLQVVLFATGFSEDDIPPTLS